MALKDADVEIQKVIYSIYLQNNSDYVQIYDQICDETKLPLKEVKKLVGILKKLGYVETVNAVDDEGLMRGRGFWIIGDKWAEVGVLCELLEERKLV